MKDKEKEKALREARYNRLMQAKVALDQVLYNIPLTGKQKEAIVTNFEECMELIIEIPYLDEFGETEY